MNWIDASFLAALMSSVIVLLSSDPLEVTRTQQGTLVALS
jgi:hypothetical protein